MVLAVHNLTKVYPGGQGLRDLSLRIVPGEIYGLLGPNGAGKTTLIHLLCGWLQADGGTMTFRGETLDRRHRASLGLAPQENLFYRSLTCRENLIFFARLYGLWGPRGQARLHAVLNAVQLAEVADRPGEQLSGGMQRRLNLAIALIHRPPLLILDEPTTGLDQETRAVLWSCLQQLQQEGVAILLSTHGLEEAEHWCQRFGILKEGRLVAEGNLGELRSRVPAQTIALIQTPQTDQAIARAQDLGLPHRQRSNDLMVWLPQAKTLAEILDLFQGIDLTAITCQAVGLGQIYGEIVGDEGVARAG